MILAEILSRRWLFHSGKSFVAFGQCELKDVKILT